MIPPVPCVRPPLPPLLKAGNTLRGILKETQSQPTLMLCRFLERIPREVPRNILQINQPNICPNQFLLRFFLLLLHHHLLLTPIILLFLIVALLFFCRAGGRFLDIRYLACA